MKIAKIILLVLLLGLSFLFISHTHQIHQLQGAVIVNEKGETLPFGIYARELSSGTHDGNAYRQENVFEIRLFPQKNADCSPIIVLVPKYKLIGEANRNFLDFIFVGERLFQVVLDDEGNTFTSLESTAFYGDPPPIHHIKFAHRSIEFNSFGDLSKYGKIFYLKY